MGTSLEQLAANRPSDPYAPRKIVRWEDPPDTASLQEGRRHTAYTDLAAELRANPGLWARLDDRSTAGAAYQFVLSVVRGKVSAFRPVGAYEAANQGTGVWVRYVGEPQEVEPDEPVHELIDTRTFGADELVQAEEPDLGEPLHPVDEPARQPDPRHAFTF